MNYGKAYRDICKSNGECSSKICITDETCYIQNDITLFGIIF